ncbi:MAG: hypothetical protein HY016_13560 [Nitrosomonadales bacterium]|nr:hypothetical protein [Nitrosomonadales bacterium]
MKNILEEHINIIELRTIGMQRMMDAVTADYDHYTCGTVSIERCLHLVKKLNLNYQVLANRNERARRTRAGLGSGWTKA